ncbi:MAG: pyrimidine utilization protein D [Hyphomonas sp.]|uniref:pyrimidine utilization protein D n=1 Tax=Hyphomonas sp. TaxID=87 RepID=UPI0034A020A0
MAVAAGLHWEVSGPEDGAPLLLSSGLGGSASYWGPNLSALAATHRVITYDHRGTGRSDRALPVSVKVDDLAGDMMAVLDAAGAGKASVLGHAAGGIAALALALNAPDRVDRLVIVNGWSRPDPHFLRCFETRLALLRKAGTEAYLRAQPIFLYPANWISAHHAELEAELPHQMAQFPGAETMEKRIAALAAFDIDARLNEIDAPALVVTSRDDILVPSSAGDRLAYGLPNALKLEFESGGHACNVTEAQEFNRIIPAWLAGERRKES